MTKYCCDNCNNFFTKKVDLTKHIKNNCNNNDNKQKLGQFFTTNYKYILQNFTIPDNITDIIEPFTGNGDLLNFINIKEKEKNKKYNIECYDIEPKKDFIIFQDTINNPPDYNNKFIITNPPYLARNKSNEKELFNKYDVNDLYKCFIKNLLTNKCIGGIIIIPLNFWSSIRKADIELRKLFLDIYEIIYLNIFEESVFEDTTTTVCSFQFSLKIKIIEENNNKNKNNLNISIYPSNNKISTILNNENNYMIGGHIYNLKSNNKYSITRLTSKNNDDKKEFITNILVKCIDDNKDNQINMSFVNDIYIDNTPNLTARTYATLVIEPKLNIENQKKLINNFNIYLKENREKYNSLFLTNYRESKDIARKRISFDLIYNICDYLLE